MTASVRPDAGISDADLHADLSSRVPSAFMRVYDRCVGALYPLALQLAGRADTAEWVIEDVFLALWRDPADALAQPGGVPSYLVEAVRRRAAAEIPG